MAYFDIDLEGKLLSVLHKSRKLGWAWQFRPILALGKWMLEDGEFLAYLSCLETLRERKRERDTETLHDKPNLVKLKQTPLKTYTNKQNTP